MIIEVAISFNILMPSFRVTCQHVVALLVLLALAFLTPLFFYVPTAALSAIIIMAVVDLIDFSLLPTLWRLKSKYNYSRFSIQLKSD